MKTTQLEKRRRQTELSSGTHILSVPLASNRPGYQAENCANYGEAQTCITVLRPFGEHFIGPIALEDQQHAQITISPLTDHFGKECWRICLSAFAQRFRALLRAKEHRTLVGLLPVGNTRRYQVGVHFLYSGSAKLFLRPLHLHATPPALLEVLG